MTITSMNLQGDRGAGGVAGDVCARHPEVVEQRCRVERAVGDAHLRHRMRATGPIALVVQDQAAAVG
jgi:hypothetical protein